MTLVQREINLQRPAWWLLLDGVLINLASALAWYIRYELAWFRSLDPVFYTSLTAYAPLFAGLTALLLLVLSANGTYNVRRGLSLVEEMFRVANAALVALVLLVAITFFARPLAFSRLLFFYDGVLIVALLGTARAFRRLLEERLRARGYNLVRVLIVGGGEAGRSVMSAIMAQPQLGYDVVGFLDDNPQVGSTDIGRYRALGSTSQFENVLRRERVREAIITLPWHQQPVIGQLMASSARCGVAARVVPDMFQLNLSRVTVDEIAGVPLIGLKDSTAGTGGRVVKRTIDLALALLLLVCAAPILALIALLIAVDSRGPVLFSQLRVGWHGRQFRMLKFRSMQLGAEEQLPGLASLNEASGPLFKIRDDPRHTRVGRWLRRLSWDELPQLVNVLRGEMSLVGPRPGLPVEVAQYLEWHRERLHALPGITGLWQVSGRSDVSFDEMCLMDIYYMQNWSLAMDTTILLRTVPRALFGRGAY